MRDFGVSNCYAYRSRSKKSEHLIEHLRNVARCCRDRWESRGLARKLAVIYGVNEDLVEDLIYVAALLHDVGKASREYQLKCETACEEFPNHYILSAQFSIYLGRAVGLRELYAERIGETFDQLLWRGEIESLTVGQLYTLMVVVPILLHHYAQINPGKLTSREQYGELQVHEGCLKELRELFKEVANDVRTEFAREVIMEAYKEFSTDSVISDIPPLPLKREHLFGLKKPMSQRFIAEAVLGVLNLCDGVVAARSRL